MALGALIAIGVFRGSAPSATPTPAQNTPADAQQAEAPETSPVDAPADAEPVAAQPDETVEDIAQPAEEVVEGAQIVTTVTADKQYATILTDNMVGAGIHINAVGGDCPGKTELHPDILLRSDIFVEYPPQTRIEGEIQQLSKDHPVTELWRVFAGKEKGRQRPDQTTLFDSVGFATEDFSALRYVRSKLPGTSYFDSLDMLADPDDPRDLFGMILRAAKAA